MTSWERQRDEWAGFLRECFPLDLPAHRAVYIVDAIEAGPKVANFHPESPRERMAWTSPALDLQLQPRLETFNEWRGRGFAMCIRDLAVFTAESATRQLAIVLHEFCHYIDLQAEWHKAASGWDVIAEADPVLVAEVLAELSARPQPVWYLHEARFIRAACHVHHRASLNGFRGELAGMTIAGPTYGLSHVDDYRKSLGDEPTELVALPIAEILNTPEPVMFGAQFEADTEWFQRRQSCPD